MEPATKASSLRWKILRKALLRRPPTDPDHKSESGINQISRKSTHGFNLIPFQSIEQNPDENSLKTSGPREICICYTLPINGAPKLYLHQRVDSHADLSDFEICNQYNIDNTGLVCSWPSEDVLAYYCLTHTDMFRSKRVIELGSGYGLAGLVVAAASEASHVVITDGNPQICAQEFKTVMRDLLIRGFNRNISANSAAFGGTLVNSRILHWDQDALSDDLSTFDIIIASDCTFFKDFHKGLARTVEFLLSKVGPSEALFFSPKRGDSLDKFLVQAKEAGLHFTVTEIYDTEAFVDGDERWPNYDKDHCYPLLIRLTH